MLQLEQSTNAVPTPPPVKISKVSSRKVGGKITNSILQYRHRLVGVENNLARRIDDILSPVFKHITQVILNPKNPTLLSKLSAARAHPSVIPILDASQVAVHLSSASLLEARKPKSLKSPLLPSKVQDVVDYLVNEIKTHLDASATTISNLIHTTALEILDMEPKIVASIVKKSLPKSVVSALANKGMILFSTEPPILQLLQIANDPLGGPKHAAALIKRYGKAVDKIRATLTTGLLNGDSIPAITRSIAGVLKKDISSGLTMLARTEVQRAATQANKELFGMNKDIIKSETWLSTLDTRVCIQCGNLDGEEFEVGKGPYPVADTHPNCRCIRIPNTKSWKDLGLDIDEVPSGERASMDGTVSSRVTFDDWFKKQSKEYQKEILGKTRYDLFSKGELTLDQFSTNNRTLTIKQLTKKYDVEVE
jgi:SPP1 gp7 family putative phage head morphogenesis protein